MFFHGEYFYGHFFWAGLVNSLAGCVGNSFKV